MTVTVTNFEGFNRQQFARMAFSPIFVQNSYILAIFQRHAWLTLCYGLATDDLVRGAARMHVT